MPIEILHETDRWLAVAKPAEISVHNDPGSDLVSLVQEQNEFEEIFPVNRLDLGTSGIVLLAKDKEAAQQLGALIAERHCEKFYSAVVHGRIEAAEDQWQSWTWPLTKKAEGRKNPRGMSRDRVPCETRWRVVEFSDKGTKLDIQLITGRKHQIRRHSAIAKHPVLGDSRYGKGKGGLDRLALHARELVFVDPFFGDEVRIVCAEPGVLDM